MSRRYFPLLLTSVALPLTLLMAGAAAVHAEIVIVPTVPGSLTAPMAQTGSIQAIAARRAAPVGLQRPTPVFPRRTAIP